MSALSAGVVQGVLLPEGTLWSPWAQVLATFVAINTVMYVAVAVAKIMPKVHLGDWLSQSYARAESRSRSRCSFSLKMRPLYSRSPSQTASPFCTAESNGLMAA